MKKILLLILLVFSFSFCNSYANIFAFDKNIQSSIESVINWFLGKEKAKEEIKEETVKKEVAREEVAPAQIIKEEKVDETAVKEKEKIEEIIKESKAKENIEIKITSRRKNLPGQVKTRKRIIALTFDDGPHEKCTEEILEILKQNEIHATFFVIGRNLQAHPEIVKEAYKNGNVIGNHSFSHSRFTTLSEKEIVDELLKTNELIYNTIGVYPLLFRYPYGGCSDKSREVVDSLGFTTIAWCDATNDYDADKTTSEKIAEDIIKLAKPGAIIILHDGGGDREKTVQALPIIIKALKEKGYRFLTLPELLKVEAYRKPKDFS
jgi:peptidoglycan/xylan/chitin deacetylase (PgdA/CDA1 family)